MNDFMKQVFGKTIIDSAVFVAQISLHIIGFEHIIALRQQSLCTQSPVVQNIYIGQSYQEKLTVLVRNNKNILPTLPSHKCVWVLQVHI